MRYIVIYDSKHDYYSVYVVENRDSKWLKDCKEVEEVRKLTKLFTQDNKSMAQMIKEKGIAFLG